MEFPGNEFFDAVPLSEALPVLAASNRARKVLKGALRDGELDDAIKMLQSKSLTNDLGDRIHDFFVDEIGNECEVVWSAIVKHPEDEDYDFPISVCEYEGVYFVHQQELDDVGYFLSKQAAKSYLESTWIEREITEQS